MAKVKSDRSSWTFFGPKVLLTQSFVGPKFFGLQILLDPKFCCTQNCVENKILLDPKKILTQNFFDSKFFLSQIFLIKTFLDPRYFWIWISKTKSGSKYFCSAWLRLKLNTEVGFKHPPTYQKLFLRVLDSVSRHARGREPGNLVPGHFSERYKVKKYSGS